MKQLNNSRGNITLLACLLLFTTSFWVIHFLNTQLEHNRELRKHFSALLCVKEYNGRLKDINYKVEKANSIIRAANVAMVAGIKNPLVAKVAYQTKKWAQRYQQLSIFSYMKNLIGLNKNLCLFHPRAYKTPFKLTGLKLKRNFSGTTVNRRKEWSDYVYSNQRIFQTDVKLQSSQTSLKTHLLTTEALPWLKL